MARFKKTHFKISNISFKHTYFFEQAIFNDMIIANEISINLIDTIFYEIPNFLHMKNDKKEKYKINVNNRETARIIKDSFEKQNNIIESNRFYALEMEQMEKELDKNKKGKSF